MYVCPNCHEEIPDRVRDTQDECPFCREPWPGEAVDIPKEPESKEPRRVSGPAAASSTPGAVPGPAAAAAEGAPEDGAEPIHAEPPKSSKLWLIIVLLVVVLGGGGAAVWFFGFRKGASSKKSGWEIDVGGTKVTLKKVYEEDYEYMLKWQREVRKAILKYLADRCETYRAKGFKFASSLVQVERMLTAKKKIEELKLEIKPVEGKAAPKASFNWFKCPNILAFVHKEHAISIQMTFTAKEQTLGPTLRRAVVEVKGGRFVAGRGTYKSSWDLGRRGLKLSALRKASVHPSVRALSRNKLKRIGDAGKEMKLGGIHFKKIKHIRGIRRGGFVVGVWTAKLQTDTFVKLLESWARGCRRLKKTIREISKTYEDKEKFKLPPLKEKINDVATHLCRGMTNFYEGAKGKWNQSMVTAAQRSVEKSLELAQKTINGPLAVFGKKVRSDQKPAGWCGDLKTGTTCAK